jgi:6-phosphogluconolactonase (cycloisomerase 2 family)
MKTPLQNLLSFALGLLLMALAACGGGSGGGSHAPITTYTIGGTVNGLTGTGLVLQNNASGDLAVSAAGAFTFATALSTGTAYAVSVKTQPSSPTQNCVVTTGSGTVATSNVTDVAVACTTAAFMIGGVVSELTGSGLVLQNNGGDDLPISASGPFTFSTSISSGAAYDVTIKTQPSAPAQICSVGRGTGTIHAQGVANISIACGLHFAYVANAGDNTLSEYTVDSFTGALTAVGTPVATGASPHAISGSPDRHHVYVVNEGSNNISAYSVNAGSGALTAITGSPFAAGTGPQALAFDPSGAYLYVANKGSNNISAYAVNASTGALTPLSTATYATGAGPSAISIDRSGTFVFVANNGGSNDISVFAITAGTGALTPVAGSPFDAGDNPHSLVLGRFGGLFVYTANFNGTNSTISGFRVDPFNGALIPLAGSPYARAVSNDIGVYSRYGDSLFVTTGDRVVGYYVNPPTLTASDGYSATTGIDAYSVTVDQLHSRLYVTNYGAASVSGYEIDDLDGTLTAVPGSPFPAGNSPAFIAIL